MINTLDIILIVVFLVMLYNSINLGIVYEVIDILEWTFSIGIGFKVSTFLASYVYDKFDLIFYENVVQELEIMNYYIYFSLFLLATTIALRLIILIIHNIVVSFEFIKIEKYENIIVSILLCLTKYVFIFMLTFNFLRFYINDDSFIDQSVIATNIIDYTPVLNDTYQGINRFYENSNFLIESGYFESAKMLDADFLIYIKSRGLITEKDIEYLLSENIFSDNTVEYLEALQ